MKITAMVAAAGLAMSLALAGCGPVDTVKSAAGGSDSDKYCQLYANMAANAVHNMGSAMGGSAADQDKVVNDLLKEAPASASDLKAAAPPDQRKLWEKMATDPDLKTSHEMNVWAVQNCAAKYQPVIKAYGKYR